MTMYTYMYTSQQWNLHTYMETVAYTWDVAILGTIGAHSYISTIKAIYDLLQFCLFPPFVAVYDEKASENDGHSLPKMMCVITGATNYIRLKFPVY